ncbi:arylesterase [Pedobacter panaciterrae]|jgi:Lysophospholipase L1 and related esterases|uniref:Arylesterase n=1 Tax=Pedobacter panaciterrae TaxID=363849 RepID=A0ABU8NN95_9SPHI|nr:arylesterase [Pedobacter panaciterrae]NQX52571.1 arylesterase [Pedobacter panaciterrae]
MLRFKASALIILLSIVLASCGNNQNKEPLQAKPAEAAPVATEVPVKQKNILFFGTSLTAGYGLEQGEAYPELLQKKLDSLKLPYKAINGGLSGETSAAGKNRIDWLLKQPIAVFVLELGANDGLRGIAVNETTANLQTIIDKVKKKYPQAKMILTGMEVPPNMGAKYASDFRNMFKTLAAKNEMVFLPFLLEGVAGIPKLNQNDGIHPTAEGQKILAENVWTKLKGVL